MCFDCFYTFFIHNKLQKLVIKSRSNKNKKVVFEYVDDKIFMYTDEINLRALVTREQADRIIKFYLDQEEFYTYYKN